MKDIWMYLLPSGFIASLLTWLANRRRERLKDIREDVLITEEQKPQHWIWWKVLLIVVLTGIIVRWRSV